MSVEIAVRGSRTSAFDWDAIQAVPKEELPSLTPEQQQVARRMRIPEEEYARTTLATKRGMEKLLDKTERLAGLLRKRLQERAPSLELTRVALDTLKGKFEVEARLDGHTLTFRVDEKLVDDLFEGGSEIAEKRLERVIDLALVT
jgi:hypothetical protein